MIERPQLGDRLVRAGPVALACPVALFLAAGVGGGAIGTVGVGLWLVSPVAAFALTQVGLLLVVPELPSLTEIALIEGGLCLLLAADGVGEFHDSRSVGGFGLLAVAGMTTTVAVHTVGIELWKVTASLVTVFVVSSYLLYRYEHITVEGPDHE